MKLFTMPQYTPEWWAERRGVPTASGAKQIFTPAKGEYSKGAIDYAYELVADMYDPAYGIRDEYVSAAMKNGTIMEPEARRWYEWETGCDVTQVGFCKTDDDRFGCSPDGLVGDDGGLELKSPSLKVHARYLIDGGIPIEHRHQVHWSLIVTGRKWWDYMSYAHGLPPFRVRVEPNEFTDKLRAAMELFWTDFTEIRDKIAALIPPPPPPVIHDYGVLGTVEQPAFISPF